MNTLHTKQDWFDRLLPEGLLIPSTTLLSGPGGSGKPLIGNVIVAAWLRQGGSVVFMPLQYPDHSFSASSLKNIAHLDLDDNRERVAFIELDATIETMTEPEDNRFKANVVKPDVWETAVTQAINMVPNEGPGILIFVSALNLLLFSATYGEAILETIKATTQGEQPYTYLFSTSTTAKAGEIARLEAVVDSLIVTHSTKKPFQLYMQIERIKDAPFLPDEILVPFSANLLTCVKRSANMCQVAVYLDEEKIMDSVMLVEPIPEGIRLVKLFEPPLVVSAVIRQVDLMKNKLFLVSIPHQRTSESSSESLTRPLSQGTSNS